MNEADSYDTLFSELERSLTESVRIECSPANANLCVSEKC